MESRLKERLTGAAILVALIVLLVPEMFHGQRGDVAATASSGEGPPVRSYTIDLSNGPARTAPLQSTPATPTSGAASDNATESSPPSTLPPAAPIAAPTPAPSGAAARSSTSAASKAPPSPAPMAPAGGSHTSNGAWSVQLGIFAQHENAEKLMHSAQVKGFAASISERDAKGLYHVQVGNLGDHAAAQTLQGRLHDQGFAAALVPPSAGPSRLQPH
jgi:DedD protein